LPGAPSKKVRLTETRGFGASWGRPLRPFPSSTRACGAVWHRRSSSDSLPGVTVRAAGAWGEMPGFFALAAERPFLRAARDPGRSSRCGDRASEAANSLRLSAGGANEETAPRARDCHSADRLDSFLGCFACFTEPGPTATMSGFSAHDDLGSHAPSTNSTLGLAHAFNWNAEPINEGPAPTLRLLPALAPFLRRRRSKGPRSGTPISSIAGLCHLVEPCGPSSVTAPRCLESVSTTDVSRHEHPCRDTTFGDCPPSAVGNPPTFDLEIAFESMAFLRLWNSIATPDHLAVIRPPTAARLTARCRLWADWLPLLALTREVGVKRRSLVGWQRLRRIAPSDASRGRRGMARG
jgi:hypothetical protein